MIRTVALLATLLTGVAAAPPALAVPPPTCTEVRRAVSLVEAGNNNQTVVGTLCTPGRWAPHEHSIDLLVHGGTYNSTYWDWPVHPQEYSWVDRALADGRATFSYDRVGAGRSSHPASALLTEATDAFVLHQLVRWLRPSYPDLSVVSHSMGSIAAIGEAARWNDADRLVVTGILHFPSLGSGLVESLMHLYPATLDPQFALAGFDPGYLTTTAGARGPAFYDLTTADPDVVLFDEQHKDVASGTQVTGMFQRIAQPPDVGLAQQVTRPTLVMVGQRDALFCALVLNCLDDALVEANERPYYARADLTVRTVPDTGHDLALHPTAGASYEVIRDWIESH